MGCCGNNKKFPSKLKQIKNLSVTSADVISHALKTGKMAADKETVEKRLSICNGCRYKVSNRCAVCGCYLNDKAGLAAAHCDLKKW